MRTVSRLAPILLLVFASIATAQSNKGGINGTVFDESGGVLPGATVVITNIGTNESLELTTSAAGTFSAPLLDPVEYRVVTRLGGFKEKVISPVKVDTATT